MGVLVWTIPTGVPMTPGSQHPQEPKQYICDDDDLGCLHDYLVAALDGNDISELPRLWNTQIGVIRSRPHTSARSEQEIRETMLEDLTKFIRGNSETIEADDGTLEDAVFCGDLFAWIDRQRRQPPSQQ